VWHGSKSAGTRAAPQMLGKSTLPCWSQFHQRFTRAFFVRNFGAKLVFREKLLNLLSDKK